MEGLNELNKTLHNLPNANNGTSGKPQKSYGKIVLTLHNCSLPESTFNETPSQADGLDSEDEQDLRILGCEMIQTAGMLLNLPQVAMATAQMCFQRFYYLKSLVRYPMERTAMGSICLASKVEEKLCQIPDIINVFHHIKQMRAQKIISPLLIDKNYNDLQQQVIDSEAMILKKLGFCVYFKHPHKLIVVYLQLLKYEKNKRLVQLSWNYMNDALRTDVFMRFSPETIACACIYLGARKTSLPLPNKPHWFLLFKVTEEDIRFVCTRILKLYSRPKVNPDVLEHKISNLKKIYQAKKNIKMQALREKEAKAEDKKSESPSASTSRDSKRDSKNMTSPTTPPISSKNHHKMRDRGERRSRSPHDRKRDYASHRYTSTSKNRQIDRPRGRHTDDMHRLPKKYDYYKRSEASRHSRDYKRKY